MYKKGATCCFTGHRQLPPRQIETIIKRLNKEMDWLICQGVSDFLSGGARGFDQIAAALVISKRELGHDIRLTFALPCRNQDALWTRDEKELYRLLLAEADDIHYVSELYSEDCMRMRNHHMVDRCDYCCLCALIHAFSGTAQTVGYARKKGIRIINVVAGL